MKKSLILKMEFQKTMSKTEKINNKYLRTKFYISWGSWIKDKTKK